MAVKSHLRNNNPVVLAISTNDIPPHKYENENITFNLNNGTIIKLTIDDDVLL